MEKHLDRENAGERFWALEALEILSALAVEEAHILSAIVLLRYLSSVSLCLVISNLKGFYERVNNGTPTV